MDPFLFMMALLAYIGAAAYLVLGREGRWGLVALGIGLLIHLGGLVTMTMDGGLLPVSTARGSTVVFTAIIAGGCLLVGQVARAGVLTGLLVSLCAVMLGVSLLLPNPTGHADPNLATLWFPLHALGNFIGLSSFALAFGVGCAYLIVRRRLKSKKFQRLGQLPSIESLDRLNARAVVVGFLALTLGIASGGAWAQARGDTEGLGPIVWISLVVWVWYAAAVLVRVVGGWRGRLTAHFSVFGFTAIVLGIGAAVLAMRGWHG